MDRGLVLIENTDLHADLLREAREHALGADADLVLLVTLTEDEFEETQEVLDTIGDVEHTSYTEQDAFKGAMNDAEEVAREVFGTDDEVSYEIVPRIASEKERAETVIEVAEEEGADHVFILGRNRSPTGKALFGDLAQFVILNFDGYVTLHTE
ncbi:universal stress protein [Haloferax sp. Atlit-12N]|uniref:Universal stress protein n=2 Tax=Haloferax gibbonsii TaxID=35746 RepID=A0A0K1IY98_HALGI|nr:MULTISPECIES: universal stress protein [Haloferax]AKU09290.1 universal stress protein [Haloferax gibbonsii]ELZ85259.1 uspA domain protein [Haloferax gibbonsii ATCC 33959]QOS13328.1 UspA domain protein [Haloferax gibbonsii]RDZ62508.1 universal stress protein [Haloferax sp. Atlit-12N]REA02620.1 universal stress protein [Haloferax sp. Atlit-6N]